MPPIKRKTWDHAAMIQAVNAVRRKEIGYLRAAKQFGVPKGTLERYVKRMSAQKILSSVTKASADEEFSIFNDGDEEQDLLNVQRNDENADLEDTSCVLTSIENQSEPTEILPNSGITNDNPSDEYQGLASSKTASTASVYDNPVPSTSSSVSPFALKPVPRLPKNNSSSKKTRTGAASIITASPYKKSLEES
ncbi:hypothetical protein HHI36_002732 [Cryptolaemus montrouzieri]|uniref:HTH psq-type domain-containing protein n=1 Tax=Cryptolaemus montrouzieri TaxID=559131 RepID=A0ABD2PBG3_9CUCU